MNEKQFDCPKCGKPLIYDENLDCYYCIDCNEYHNSEDFEVKEENAFTGKYDEVSCLLCGKRFIVSKNFNYDVCPFCFNNLIDRKEGVSAFKPNFIIPFAENLQTFKSNFFNRAKLTNIPIELLTGISEDTIKGVYVPVYVFTIENNAKGFIQTKDVDDYGDDFYRQKITYLEVVDVLVDSTDMISAREMADFADYNLKKIDMFFPEKLGDYYTLFPTAGADATWNKMKSVVKDFIEKEVSKYKGKKEAIKEVKVFNSIKNLSRRLVLIPVWMMETRVGEEMHHIYANGQTGRIVSDVEFTQPAVKKGLFGKKEIENYGIRVVERESIKRQEFRSSIEYLNELRKYEVNQNDRLANIRKIR